MIALNLILMGGATIPKHGRSSSRLARKVRSGVTVVQYFEPGSAARRTAIAIACVLIVLSVAAAARASVLKKCPSGSSLSSAAGTQVKLDHQAKLSGQLVCTYLTRGAALADLTVETLSNDGLSATGELKKLEAGARAGHYKVTLLHGLGSAAFEETMKGTNAEVDVAVSGHLISVGSLAVSPAHVVAVARAVVH